MSRDPVVSLLRRFSEDAMRAQKRHSLWLEDDPPAPLQEPTQVSGPVRWNQPDPVEDHEPELSMGDEVPEEDESLTPAPRGHWITLQQSARCQNRICHRELHRGDTAYVTGDGQVACSSTCAQAIAARPSQSSEKDRYPKHPIGPFHQGSVVANLLRRLE